MDNLLSGLDKLGLKTEGFDSIYDEPEEAKAKVATPDTKKILAVDESELVFDKTVNCPVCGRDFKTKAVRTGKAKLMGTDTDLKPIYQGFEPLKYDIVVCLHCGYAATGRTFPHITPGQMKLVRENISKNFKGFTNSTGVYSYVDALDRHKLALLNTMVTRSKNSERAYICLKMAWLYRSMYNSLQEGDANAEVLRKEYKEEEMKCIKSAYEGFSTSLAKEVPPICGMDVNTVTYLLAELARRCGDIENSKKYLAMIYNTRNISAKLRERARELKDLLGQDSDGE